MTTHCTVCGQPLSSLEAMLAESDSRFQCHHCWTHVKAARAEVMPHGHHWDKKRRVVRRTVASTGKKR